MKFIRLFFLSIVVFFCFVPFHKAEAVQPPMLQEPAYAKWGRLAVFETGKRYPDFNIVDYLHAGRQNLPNGFYRENFKLWLRGKNREMGVWVRITVNPNGTLSSISFQETDR